MASFSFYGSSQTSLVQALVSPTQLPEQVDRSLTIPAELQNISPEYLQKIQGILSCERIPLDGRVIFLNRMVRCFKENRERFFGQMGVMNYLQAQALNQLFMNHITKSYTFHKTLPNGSCGFEALAMPFQDKGWTVANLRVAIGKYIRRNLEKLKTRDEQKGGFADVLEVQTKGVLDDEKLENYIKRIETPAAISDGWLSAREIAIFVHCMHNSDINVIVNVHSHFGYDDELRAYVPQVYNTNLRGEKYVGDNPPIEINLYWDGGGHYDYLDPKPAQ